MGKRAKQTIFILAALLLLAAAVSYASFSDRYEKTGDVQAGSLYFSGTGAAMESLEGMRPGDGRLLSFQAKSGGSLAMDTRIRIRLEHDPAGDSAQGGFLVYSSQDFLEGQEASYETLLDHAQPLLSGPGQITLYPGILNGSLESVSGGKNEIKGQYVLLLDPDTSLGFQGLDFRVHVIFEGRQYLNNKAVSSGDGSWEALSGPNYAADLTLDIVPARIP